MSLTWYLFGLWTLHGMGKRCVVACSRCEQSALKQKSRILGQWYNPVCGSRKSQASSPWVKQHRVLPVPSWRNHIQGWMTVRESYSCAVEQGTLAVSGGVVGMTWWMHHYKTCQSFADAHCRWCRGGCCAECSRPVRNPIKKESWFRFLGSFWQLIWIWKQNWKKKESFINSQFPHFTDR